MDERSKAIAEKFESNIYEKAAEVCKAYAKQCQEMSEKVGPEAGQKAYFMMCGALECAHRLEAKSGSIGKRNQYPGQPFGEQGPSGLTGMEL